mmetsp:Transcript_96665/g.272949  ORF Transcript_96665/g.272949 Transcript_96665/m.272949 type:complete len:287 (-) Transcript_96665:20-880(-)
MHGLTTMAGCSLVSLLDGGREEVLRLLSLLDNHGNAGIAVAITVQLHELGNVELRLLNDLHLPDVRILQREDALGLLLDLLADDLGDQLLDKLAELHGARLLGHDLNHLLADLANLRRPRIAIRLDLLLPALGEGNAEQAHDKAIRGLHVRVPLDQGLPLADECALLVTGQLHAVEVGQAVPALNLLDAQLDLLVGLVLVVVQVGQVQLQHPALESLRCDLGARGPRDEGLAALARAEHGGRLDVVPLLLHEGVALLLLAALLAALCEALVLADRHSSEVWLAAAR